MKFTKSLLLLFSVSGAAILWPTSQAAMAGEAKASPTAAGAATREVSLVRNGTAVRSVFGFDVYRVGLYLAEQSADADAICRDRCAKRVQITMMREVSGKKFEATVLKNIDTNFSTREKRQFASELDSFLDCFRDFTLRKDDVVNIDFVPDKGMLVSVDGHKFDMIPGDDFYHAILRLWIGNPPQSSVKEGLLGKN